MSTGTGIEWTDATWNPIAGCTPVSPGCINCYAAKMSYMNRVGKKNAGRLLDGRTWDEYPEPAEAAR